MARIRDDSDRLVELFAEVAVPRDSSSEAWILRTHPTDYSNKEILNSVPYFAYPCSFKCDVITHFSFVLTNIKSKWTFGYCRHTPDSDTCLVVLSDLPWHSTFYKILDHCAELLTRKSALSLDRFLEALYTSDLPQPGLKLSVTYTAEDLRLREFTASCPDHQKLPCIPEDRNITEYFNAVTPSNMIAIFASMLNERRIVITSARLNRLSASVQAANALIYPMHWQHIFIPLLPSQLIEYLSAPMPFLIGVPQVTLSQVKSSEMGDVVLLNADTNQLVSPFDDVSTLPSDVLHHLRKSLKQSSASLGDGLCRAFMRALVLLIGGYRDALRLIPGEKISFDREAFVTNVRGTSRQLFLEKMLQLQIFQQFIESRLDMFNRGERFVDQFEIELNHNENTSNSRFKAQYREWAAAMRKEGGALLRAVNPKVKSAISRSRQAVRNLRAIIVSPNNHLASPMPDSSRASSAPSSPKLPPKIKKSISGTAISQTSRTVTYVRNPQGVTTVANSRFMTGSLASPNHRPLNSKTAKILSVPTNGVAPSASSESSDIEENDFPVPRIDVSIKDDLESIFQKKCEPRRANGQLNGQVLPIPPPRSERSMNGNRTNHPKSIQLMGELQVGSVAPAIAPDKCLIEFDSPPKESPAGNNFPLADPSLGALIFDPLLENKHSHKPLETNNNYNFPSLNNYQLYPTLPQQQVHLPVPAPRPRYSPSQPASFGQFPAATNQMVADFGLLSTHRRPLMVATGSTSSSNLGTGDINSSNPFQTQCWQKFD